MPIISVVIPLFNKEKQIKRTIDSVLNQEFDDFEVVVINDGSTDNSLHIVEAIKDSRIRIITQQNSGVAAARNRGIKEASGDYVLLLDADDQLLPGALNVVFDTDMADIVVASFLQTDEDGKVVRKAINKSYGLLDNPYKSFYEGELYLRMGNMFIRREVIYSAGLLLTEMTLYEDLEWILRLIDSRLVFCKKNIVLKYVRGENGLSHGFKPIELDYANTASVKNVHDKYKKKIIGDFVFRRLYYRLKVKDWHGIKRIIHNNSFHLMFCFISFLSHYINQRFKVSRNGNK